MSLPSALRRPAMGLCCIAALALTLLGPARANADEAIEPADPEEEIDDGHDDDALAEPPRAASAPPKSGVLALDPAALAHQIRNEAATLGPMSLGRPSAGALFNGVRMPRGEQWVLIDPHNAWATQETIDFLAGAIAAVNAAFPGTAPVAIGHISAQRGGHLRPHVSHQAGRDVDLGYYYRDDGKNAGWFRRATAESLDVARSWALVRALVTETDAELILVDTSVQRLLKAHALARGEDAAWLDSIFEVGSRRSVPLIRHARGHDTHIHVRFFNPVAQELGRRALPTLSALGRLDIKRERVAPAPGTTAHRARSGDTLHSLARRYDTSVEAIRRTNGLRSNKIKAGRVYQIPVPPGRGPARVEPPRPTKLSAPPPQSLPPRRLPPKQP